MKHLFVPYELALLSKEKGFNEPCLGFFLFDKQLQLVVNDCNTNSYWKDSKTKEVSAPLYQQLVDWFREEHNIHVIPIEDDGLYSFTIKWHNGICFNEMPCKGGKYYEAINAALTEAFKLI